MNTQVLTLADEGKTAEAIESLFKSANPANTQWQVALEENMALQYANNQSSLRTLKPTTVLRAIPSLL